MARVSQTKLQLANSLKDLMQKKPLNKITVQNVTDHCGLNRQTFYYHFKDIYDLLSWVYNKELLEKIEQTQNWRSSLYIAVEYAKKNKVFLRNTNRSLRKEAMEKILYPYVYHWASLIFDSVCDGRSIRQEDRDFLITFFTSAFLNYIFQWIGKGMPYNETYSLQKVTLICDILRQYLSRDASQEKDEEPGIAASFPLFGTMQAGRSCI